jgi:hypothetical protein
MILRHAAPEQQGRFREVRREEALRSKGSRVPRIPGPAAFEGRPGTGRDRQGNPATGGKMTEQSRQPKDKNYNLIAVLYHSSDNVESLKTYI